MSEWDKVSTVAAADWDSCSVPAQNKVRERQATRATQMLALTDARNTRNDLASKNQHEEQMAAVQAEINAEQQAIEDREREVDITNRSRSLVVRGENFEVEKQELAQKAAEDEIARQQQLKNEDIAEENRQRSKVVTDRKKEEAHKDEIISAKRNEAKVSQERREERNALRDFNLRAAMSVDTTKSVCKNALFIGGTAFILWMLFKVAANFDPSWWKDHDHQHGGTPVHEQGSGQSGVIPGASGNPNGQGASNQPQKEFVPGEHQGLPFEEQAEGQMKGSDGQIYESSMPDKPFEHSGQGAGKKGENPAEWGWDKYFPADKLKTPEV